MPIPKPSSGEPTDKFLSRCMKAISGEYAHEQAYAICKNQLSKQQMKKTEEVFVLTPKKAENRGTYLSRCSAHPKMREQYPSMKERMSQCLHSFNSYYKYWSRLEEFGEDSKEAKFEGCMSGYKAQGKDYKDAYTMCMQDLIVEPVAMENMESNIEACAKKRMEAEGITHEQAIKECSASVVVQPSGGTNPSVAPQGAPASVSMADLPWDDCMEKMLKEYDGDEEVAKKVCGAIRARG